MGEIQSVSGRPLNLTLDEPFEISLGTQDEATNVITQIKTKSGVTGFGEGSPIPPITGETQATALKIIEEASDILVGRKINNYRGLIGEIRAMFPNMPAANNSLEIAILDTYCRERGIPLAELFGGQPETVNTDKSIPIVPPSEASDQAERAVSEGFEHIKIKTGGDIIEDIERVKVVAETAPDVTLRVDANQGWTPKETIKFDEQLDRRGIELDIIEQPVAADDVAGLAQTTQRTSTPIAADETVFTPQDAIRLVRSNGADVINTKLGKSGPLDVAKIVSIAESSNIDLMMGCMLESSIGIHTSAHVVAGLGAYSYVDLDGNRLLAEDVTARDSGPSHDIAGPGHGITPFDEYVD